MSQPEEPVKKNYDFRELKSGMRVTIQRKPVDPDRKTLTVSSPQGASGFYDGRSSYYRSSEWDIVDMPPPPIRKGSKVFHDEHGEGVVLAMVSSPPRAVVTWLKDSVVMAIPLGELKQV
jgi:hypothetical protein